jgi:hypothetical protein
VLLTRRVPFALAVVVVLSCKETGKTEEPAAATKVSAAPAALTSPSWDSAFGGFVGYRDDDSTIVVLLSTFSDRPTADTTYDASTVNGTTVDLFGSDGSVHSTSLRGLGKALYEEGCFSFPRGRMTPLRVAPWSVALPAGTATSIPLRRMRSLGAEDSTKLREQILTLARSVPGALDSIWRDLPITIDDAVLFEVDGGSVVAASTTRMLADEQHNAETMFFIGERPAGTSTASASARPFTLAYSRRRASFARNDETSGGLPVEDEAGAVAAVRTKSDSRPVLMLETRGNEANGYAALGRFAPGQWRVVWSGPHEGGC